MRTYWEHQARCSTYVLMIQNRHRSPYDRHPMDSAAALEPLIGCKRSQACKPNDVGEQSGAEYFLHHRRRCRRNCRAVAGRPSLR
jgi:hypothetical protein